MDEIITEQPLTESVDTSEVVETQEIQESQDSIEETNEGEEIEYEGKNYKLPRELKDALLRQSDYTKKTQEVSAERQRVDELKQQAESAINAVGSFQNEFAELTLINRQIEALQTVNWNDAINENPVEAMKLQVKYNELINKRGEVSNKISALHYEIEQRKTQQLHQAIQEGESYLAKKIPGWNSELKANIVSMAKDVGFKDNELQGITDPRMVEVLYYAKIGRETLSKLSKTTAPSQIKPTTVIKSGGTAQHGKSPDQMSTDEWLKWRNSELMKAKKR